MHVLALSGSRRPGGTTRAALNRAARAAAEAGAEISWIDLAEVDLPLCAGLSVEAEAQDPAVAALRARVAAADAVLIGSPEYHGSMSGALKNLLDLLGPDELRDKLVGVLATARGDAGAINTLNHLGHVARWMNARVLPTRVSVPRAPERFGPDGQPDAALDAELERLGRELVRYGRLLKSG